jgi:hypothetical protein
MPTSLHPSRTPRRSKPPRFMNPGPTHNRFKKNLQPLRALSLAARRRRTEMRSVAVAAAAVAGVAVVDGDASKPSLMRLPPQQ